MATNPRDRMAELLRAFARRRKEQAGAPFDLHPATRHLLQAEVARMAPRMKERVRKAAFLPRLILTVSGFAVVIVCAFILLQGGQKQAAPAKTASSNVVYTLSTGGPDIRSGSIALNGGAGIDLAVSAPIGNTATGALRISSPITAMPFPGSSDEPVAATAQGANFQVSEVNPVAPATVAVTLNGDATPGNVVVNSLSGATLTTNSTQVAHDANSNGFLTPQQDQVSFDNGNVAFNNNATSSSAGAFTLEYGIYGDAKEPANANSNVNSNIESDTTKSTHIRNKLDQIVIPSVEFHDVTVRQALDQLQKESADFDTSDADAAHKGVNILLTDSVPKLGDIPAGNPAWANQVAQKEQQATKEDEAEGAGAGGVGGVGNSYAFRGNTTDNFEKTKSPLQSPAAPSSAAAAPAPGDTFTKPRSLVAPSQADRKITLSLRNVSLSDALHQVAALGGMKMEVGSNAVSIIPATATADELFTREYAVPDRFLANANANDDPLATGGNSTANSAKRDALMAERPAETSKKLPLPAKALDSSQQSPLVAIDYLRDAGIPFPSGASADYIPATGRLIVRNTAGNLDSVNKIVDQSIDTELARETVVGRQLAVKHAIQFADGKAAAAAPDIVLATFQLQVEGDVVYIIDGDGSIYSGTLEQNLLKKMLALSNGRIFTNLANDKVSPRAAKPIIAMNQAQTVLQKQEDLQKPVENGGVLSNNLNNSNNDAIAGSGELTLGNAGAATGAPAATNTYSGAVVTAGVTNNDVSGYFGGGGQIADSPAHKQQNFFFRATGINRKLKTPVIFEGNYIAADTDQPVVVRAQPTLDNEKTHELKDVAQENTKAAAKDADTADESGVRIEGRAQVGQNGAVDVDAIVVLQKTAPGK